MAKGLLFLLILHFQDLPYTLLQSKTTMISFPVDTYLMFRSQVNYQVYLIIEFQEISTKQWELRANESNIGFLSYVRIFIFTFFSASEMEPGSFSNYTDL